MIFWFAGSSPMSVAKVLDLPELVSPVISIMPPGADEISSMAPTCCGE